MTASPTASQPTIAIETDVIIRDRDQRAGRVFSRGSSVALCRLPCATRAPIGVELTIQLTDPLSSPAIVTVQKSDQRITLIETKPHDNVHGTGLALVAIGAPLAFLGGVGAAFFADPPKPFFTDGGGMAVSVSALAAGALLVATGIVFLTRASYRTDVEQNGRTP